MSNLVSDVSRKVCQSKKHAGSGGCGDPRCPEGVALKAAYDEAVTTQDFTMFEQVKNIEQKRKKTSFLANFFGKKEVAPAVPVKTAAPRIPPAFIMHDSKGNRVIMNVAEPGTTGLRCRSCNNYLSKKVVDSIEEQNSKIITCNSCHTSFSWNTNADYRGVYLPPYKVDLKPNEAHLLVRTEDVYSQTWYHSTQTTNWVSEIKEAETFVHFGTKEAALERLQLNNNWSKDNLEGEIYELRLKRSAVISPTIHDDDNRFPEMLEQGKEGDNQISRNKISRYVNQWESPGSVSIIGDIKYFEVVRVIPGRDAKVLLEE